MQNNVANKSTDLKIKSCLETAKAPWEICQKKERGGSRGGGCAVWDARCSYLQDDVKSDKLLLPTCKGSETHTGVMTALNLQASRWTLRNSHDRKSRLGEKQTNKQKQPFIAHSLYLLDIAISTLLWLEKGVQVLSDRLLLKYFNIISRTQWKEEVAVWGCHIVAETCHPPTRTFKAELTLSLRRVHKVCHLAGEFTKTTFVSGFLRILLFDTRWGHTPQMHCVMVLGKKNSEHFEYSAWLYNTWSDSQFLTWIYKVTPFSRRFLVPMRNVTGRRKLCPCFRVTILTVQTA